MKIISAIFGTLVAANVYATETYNIEAAFQHTNSSTDGGTHTTATGIDGTYYLKPITIDGTQPFMELDVLQKASKFRARYISVRSETSSLPQITYYPVGISGTFYVDNFVFGLNNETFNLKSDATHTYGVKSTSTGFSVGYWLLPNTVVKVANTSNKATYTPNDSSQPNRADSTQTSNSFSSHTVTSVGDTQSLVLDFSFREIKQEQTSTEKNKEYAAKARYYPEAKYFFEGGYIYNIGDNTINKGKTMLLGAGYAFTPRFAMLFSTSNFVGDVSSVKSAQTSTTLTANYRF